MMPDCWNALLFFLPAFFAISFFSALFFTGSFYCFAPIALFMLPCCRNFIRIPSITYFTSSSVSAAICAGWFTDYFPFAPCVSDCWNRPVFPFITFNAGSALPSFSGASWAFNCVPVFPLMFDTRCFL